MIALRNVRKTFPGGVTAVSDVSFTVPRGTILCLIGTSGCGKTTTLKMINRLIEPTAGEIRVNDRSVMDTDPISLRRSIGYVIQKGGLMPHMTVRRNVALLEEVKGTPRAVRDKRTDELLELVGLPPLDFGARYMPELSGGQQQRVGIARALMSDPPVLLMDEPFGALDPITRNRMGKELLAIHAAVRKTVVIVTHDLKEAFTLGDRVLLMHEGSIVQQGTREDFLARPATEFVAEFVESQLDIAGKDAAPREARAGDA